MGRTEADSVEQSKMPSQAGRGFAGEAEGGREAESSAGLVSLTSLELSERLFSFEPNLIFYYCGQKR